MVRKIILANDEDVRRSGLAQLKENQVADFEGLLEAMDGLPVVVRLLDPPCTNFSLRGSSSNRKCIG